MDEPVWLPIEDIERLHIASIIHTGGSHGLRDFKLLESAIARPKNHYVYGETNIFMLAASYAEGISRNHPFIDGNKRTAFSAAGMFLQINGYELKQSEGDDHAVMMENLAQGKITLEEAGQYLQKYSPPFKEIK